MSAAVAAGCALSRSQSVSVVPTSQWRPHGMTNSTLFSVRKIMPMSELDAVAGHDEVHALRRAHLELAALADHGLRVVRPDAGRVDDLLRADLEVLARLVVVSLHADDALADLDEALDPHAAGDVRAVARRGARERRDVAGVVDLGVVVGEAADDRVLREARDGAQHLALAEVAVVRAPRAGDRPSS